MNTHTNALSLLALAVLLALTGCDSATPGTPTKAATACAQFSTGQLVTTKGFPVLTGVVRYTQEAVGTLAVSFKETNGAPVEFKCTEVTPTNLLAKE